MCAEKGSLLAASQDTGLSISTVSHHLRSLEDHLGLELFNRDRRPMMLTPKGRAFLRNIDPALLAIRKAKAEASAGRPFAPPCPLSGSTIERRLSGLGWHYRQRGFEQDQSNRYRACGDLSQTCAPTGAKSGGAIAAAPIPTDHPAQQRRPRRHPVTSAA